MTPKDFPFHYSLPEKPPQDVQLMSAKQAEELLLRQLEAHQHPEEQILFELARLYSQIGRQQEALARVKQLVAIVKTVEEKAHCFLQMGQLMEHLQDFKAAIKYYSEAMSMEPVNNETWYFIHNNLGFCLNHFSRFAEAEPYCRRAIKIEPRRYNAYKNLGISLEGQGDHYGAAKCFIKAVQMNAADPRALKHLEELSEKHPTVTVDVPEFDTTLTACRMAVQKAAEERDQILAQWEKKSTTSNPSPS